MYKFNKKSLLVGSRQCLALSSYIATHIGTAHLFFPSSATINQEIIYGAILIRVYPPYYDASSMTGSGQRHWVASSESTAEATLLCLFFTTVHHKPFCEVAALPLCASRSTPSLSSRQLPGQRRWRIKHHPTPC